MYPILDGYGVMGVF